MGMVGSMMEGEYSANKRECVGMVGSMMEGE